jgi:hypothetical protein
LLIPTAYCQMTNGGDEQLGRVILRLRFKDRPGGNRMKSRLRADIVCMLLRRDRAVQPGANSCTN